MWPLLACCTFGYIVDRPGCQSRNRGRLRGGTNMVQSGARKKECLRILLWLIPCAHYETGNPAFSMCLRFLTIRVSDLRQRGLVSFRKKQSALDLGFQDTVLRSQIFVPQQQLLIDGAGDVGRHASPVHSRASLRLIVEPGLYMLLRFQKAAVRGNYETGNQAFSKRLRFLTIRGNVKELRNGNPTRDLQMAADRTRPHTFLRFGGIF